MTFIEINAVSKFSYLEASQTTIDFKNVLLHSKHAGTSVEEKELVLQNPTKVLANFEIKSVQFDQSPIFFFSPSKGAVAPQSTLTVRVKYMPLSSGTFTCDYFDVVTPGNQHQTRLTCKGRAIGPRISLWTRNSSSNLISTSSINFRDVPVGNKVSRVLVLRNESAVDAYFHFDCQPHGIFQFETTSGEIASHSDTSITVVFTAKPPYVGNFYRRIFILTQHQGSLFVDMLATSFDEKLRPSPFEQAHIDAYRWRAKNGLGSLSPQQLENIRDDEGNDFFLSGAKALSRVKLDGTFKTIPSNVSDSTLAQYHRQQLESELLSPSGGATLAEMSICHEYSESTENLSTPITLIVPQSQHSLPFLDFGSRTFSSATHKKTLQIRNNTQAKVICMWHVSMGAFERHESGKTGNKPSFQIHPVTTEIEPGLETAFLVAFQPLEQNSYYFAELEAYVSFSSNRSFRLVDVQTFTPPWCVSIKVCGNTFIGADSHYISQLVFHGPRLIFHTSMSQNMAKSSFSMSSANHRIHFPPCYLNDSVFQTILIENTGDTPALFQFSDDATGCYFCKPNCGYISPRSIYLVQIRFSPVQLGTNKGFVHFTVNYSESTRTNVEMTGIGSIPKLIFNDHPDDLGSSHIDVDSSRVDAKVYLKPTALGLSSVRCLQLFNVSRIPLVYGFDIPDIADNVFSVKPEIGRIDGRETISVEVHFSPQAEMRKYTNRLLVTVKPISFTWKAWNQYTTKKELARAPINRRTLPVIQESGVRVISEASYGAIMFEPEVLNFDTVMIKSSIKRTFDIVNAADCDLAYELVQTGELTTNTTRIDSHSSTDSKPIMLKLDKVQGDLTLSQSSGIIPLRSRKQIVAKFFPKTTGLYNFDISCIISGKLPLDNPLSAYETAREWTTRSRCKISANASFPTIVIHDIRSMELPRSLLWMQFNCNAFNSHMSSQDLSETDPNNTGSNAEKPFVQYPSIDFFFTPAPRGSASQEIIIQLYNPGFLVAHYELLLPNEGNVEMEHWADAASPRGEKSETISSIDKQIFDFSPKKAKLLPQETKSLRLTCNFKHASQKEIHSLPLLLRIDKGKKISILLHGQIIMSDQPKIWAPRKEFRLFATIAGEFKTPPKFHRRRNRDFHEAHHMMNLDIPTQQIQIFNVGSTKLRVEADLIPVKDTELINSVLRCTTTAKHISPRSSACINVHFSPNKPQIIEAVLSLRAYESYVIEPLATKRPPGLMRRDMIDAKTFAAADLCGNAYNEACTIRLLARAFHPNKESYNVVTLEDDSVDSGCYLTQTGYISNPSLGDYSEELCGRFLPTDKVDFGYIPSHSRSSRILVLRNTSATSAMHFEWDNRNDYVSRKLLRFSPMSGIIAENGICLIRISVEMKSDIIRMDQDVACFLSRTGSSEKTKDLIDWNQAGPTMKIAAANKKHQSVISRSTAAQEAIKETRTDRMLDDTNLSIAAVEATEKDTNTNTIWPLYVHINAHPLGLQLLKKFCYAKKDFVTLHPELQAPSHPFSVFDMPPDEISSARIVLHDVMEMLLVDSFNTPEIGKSIDEACGRPKNSPSISRSMCETNGAYQSVFNDIRERSTMFNTCTALLENTFHNVIQEIAHDMISA